MAEADLREVGTPFSISFSGSGFLAIYQIGVVQSLLELAPEILKSASKVYGASAGSLIAAAVVCESSLEDLRESFHEAAKDARKTILGPLSPGCNMLRTVQKGLYKMLPENSHRMASGRLHISLTRVMDGQNIMVSEFTSKEDLIQALICSCFLPIYCGFIPPSFRGVRYVDGGFTNLQPCTDLEAVITVSPFTGELDICPRDCPAIFYCCQVFNSSIQISVENLCRISYALFPPSYLVLHEFYFRGYQDAVLFLHRNDAFGISYPANTETFRFASLLSKNDLPQTNEESSCWNPDTGGLESNRPASRDHHKRAPAVNMAINGTDQKMPVQLPPCHHKGSGFLVNYQVGVLRALWDLAPEIMRSTSKVYGASCGSLVAAAVACNIDIGVIEEFFHEAMEETRKASGLTLCPGYRMLRIIEKALRKALSENSYQRASGKLCISLTRLLDLQNVIVSEYKSNEELVQALICSCFLPFYCGFNPPSFRGVRYIDGGITNVQPRSDLETMITISPYSGEVDICPRDCSSYFSCINVLKTTVQVSVENLVKISYSIFPPSLLVLRDFYFQGYHDAIFFLQRYRENWTEKGMDKKTLQQTPLHCDKAPPALKSQETTGSLDSAAEITSQHLVPDKLPMNMSLSLTDR